MLVFAKVAVIILAVTAVWLTIDRRSITARARLHAVKILLILGLVFGVGWIVATISHADKPIDFVPPGLFILVMAIICQKRIGR